MAVARGLDVAFRTRAASGGGVTTSVLCSQPSRARCADLTLGWLGDFWQYKATLAISPALIEARLGSQPPARPSRFQIGSARGYRLVAISGIPPSNTSRRCCRSAV